MPLLQMSDAQDVTNGPGDMIVWHGANTLERTYKPGQYVRKSDQKTAYTERPEKHKII